MACLQKDREAFRVKLTTQLVPLNVAQTSAAIDLVNCNERNDAERHVELKAVVVREGQRNERNWLKGMEADAAETEAARARHAEVCEKINLEHKATQEQARKHFEELCARSTEQLQAISATHGEVRRARHDVAAGFGKMDGRFDYLPEQVADVLVARGLLPMGHPAPQMDAHQRGEPTDTH